jgi:hypothetical protein
MVLSDRQAVYQLSDLLLRELGAVTQFRSLGDLATALPVKEGGGEKY